MSHNIYRDHWLLLAQLGSDHSVPRPAQPARFTNRAPKAVLAARAALREEYAGGRPSNLLSAAESGYKTASTTVLHPAAVREWGHRQ